MEQNSEKLAKIKDRIAKLLRMADDASSPNEAAIAASRARKLMDLYQLEAFDINTGYAEEFAEKRAGRAFASMPIYMQTFAVAVAKYNDCVASLELAVVSFKKKTANDMRAGRQINFQGYKTDVQLAKDMFETLMETVNRLCKVYLEDKGYAKYPVGVGSKFKMAAIQTIYARIEEMIVERDSITQVVVSGESKSLVVIKSDAVNEHFDFKGHKAGKKVQISDENELKAYRAGEVAGRMVEITKTLES